MKRVNGAMLKIFFLGRFAVWRRGCEIKAWPQNKTQMLLKILACQRGHVYSQDQLLDMLYPELDPGKAVASLYGRFSELRRILEPGLTKGRASQFVLSTGQQSYCFNPDIPCWVDTEAFQFSVKAASMASEAGRSIEALQHAEQALELYRGAFLCEDLYEEWTFSLRERWQEVFLNTLIQAAECESRLGHHHLAIEQCRRAIEINPTCEGAYRQKMLTHYNAGEETEMRTTYQACVTALKTHLEVTPSATTQALYEQLQSHELVFVKPTYLTNLPEVLTSFIGREAEVAQITAVLRDTRLLTLTGVGGTGKTRLSLRVASGIVQEYRDGIWFIELASLSDPTLIAQIVASVLGLREQSERSVLSALKDYLKSKQLLLILDNCEHLIQACAHFAQEMLAACLEVRILATSRESLSISGELCHQVQPLSQPDLQQLPDPICLTQYEAIKLFVERAEAAHPRFELTEANAHAVAHICRQLDGLPLAIELAAARVKMLSIDQVASRLCDRFKLLTNGCRTALPRQQTLQAAMDWSFQLLSEHEQILVRRLSVFAGGWTLELAERICAGEGIEASEILDLLTHLVDKSLVLVDRYSTELRYRFLETVRQYSAERLRESGEAERVYEKHALCFLEFAERAEPELAGPDQKLWLERLEAEHDNLRNVLTWFKKQNIFVNEGLRLASALGPFWERRGYFTEGYGALVEVISSGKSAASSLERAKALNEAGRLALTQGNNESADRYAKESLCISQSQADQKGIAKSLYTIGLLCYMQGEFALARSHYEQSLSIHRTLDNRRSIALLLNALGNLAYSQGDYQRAQALYQESLALRQELGNPLGIAEVTYDLGVLSHSQGDLETACALYERSLAIQRQLGNKKEISRLLNSLANIAFQQGNFDQASPLYEESLSLHRRLGNKRGVAGVLNNVAEVAAMHGDYSRARTLYEESLAICLEIDYKVVIGVLWINLGTLALYERDFEAAHTLYEKGLNLQRMLGNRQGIANGLSHMGMLALMEDNFSVARRFYQESLLLRQEMGNREGMAENIRGLAHVAAAQTMYTKAARLLGAAQTLYAGVFSALGTIDRTLYERTLAKMRHNLGAVAYNVFYHEGRAMALEEIIVYALTKEEVGAGAEGAPASFQV
jgi:predicted ATPase/DNA-binding SARP family transcriptional activator